MESPTHNTDLSKTQFYNKLKEIRDVQASNSGSMTQEKYNSIIKELKIAKRLESKKPRDFWLRQTYDILVVQNKEKLIVPIKEATSDIIYYVVDEEIFDILQSIHVSIGQGGRDRMLRETRKKYKNITQNEVKLFLELCQPCQQKLKGPKKGIVVKPLLFKEMNSRCQVDLIDFQSHPDGEHKFIMVYQDHLTKFVLLHALKNKTAQEVAQKLVDIFTIIGAPSILQSDNGWEFRNQIVESLKSIWPELKIVHGKPRHSQSQGSVERANQDIENMLTTWMQDNKTGCWAKGLRFV
jgi:hypothetical protein